MWVSFSSEKKSCNEPGLIKLYMDKYRESAPSNMNKPSKYNIDDAITTIGDLPHAR